MGGQGWLVMPKAYRLGLWGLEIISSSHPWVCITEMHLHTMWQGHRCSKATWPQWGLTLWCHWIWGDGRILSKTSLPEHSATRRISAAIFRAVKCRFIGAASSPLLYCREFWKQYLNTAVMLYKNKCLKLPISKDQITFYRGSLMFLFSCDTVTLLSS